MRNVGMVKGANDRAGKWIFNLLKAFNLYERKYMVKIITIVKTRVDEGSGDSGGSGKVKNVMEVTNLVMTGTKVLEREVISLEKDKLELKVNQRFLVEDVGGIGCVEVRESYGLIILQACCRSTIRRNSVLEGLRVRLR